MTELQYKGIEFCVTDRVVSFSLEDGIDRAGRIDLANSRIKGRKGVQFARLLREIEINEAIQWAHNFFLSIHDLSYTVVIIECTIDVSRTPEAKLNPYLK